MQNSHNENSYIIMINKSNSKLSNKDIKKQSDSLFSQSSSLYSEAFPLTLQQIKSEMFQDSKQYMEDPIKKLQVMQLTIDQKMKKLDQLNGQFYEKQQKMFLKTFLNMMDRMSNELLQAKKLYDNIDQQIDSKPECVKLRQKLIFYKDQCLFLSSSLQHAEKQLTDIKIKNKQKQIQNFQLSSKLETQIKKQKKYKHRKYSLQTKLQGFQNFITYKNTSKDKDKQKKKSISSYNNENFVDKSLEEVKNYLRDGIIKRPMTSINTYRLDENNKSKTKKTGLSSKTHRDIQFNQQIDDKFIQLDMRNVGSKNKKLYFKRNQN